MYFNSFEIDFSSNNNRSIILYIYNNINCMKVKKNNLRLLIFKIEYDKQN